METFVKISGANGLAIQLDGIITRTGTDGSNMLSVKHSSDFELLSSTGNGAIQGNGYEYHAKGSMSGPRILRLTDVSDFSVFNLAIRGGNSGGLDGIDVWSDNIFIHDVMVTNKDECVTVKSPASHIQVENIYCNWSGGSAIGSLSTGTNISNILYRNVYTWKSNQMMMIKSNGGDGLVENVVFDNFIGRVNAYSLDIDQYWASQDTADRDGVQLSNITTSNWHGTEADGSERGPIKVVCADGAPCAGITISNFAMWTEAGSSQFYTCRSAYGSGFCLKDGSGSSSYDAVTTTVSAAPSGYSAATMKEDLSTAFGITASIPIPTHPASYFPDTAPISAAP
ncbi:glycoside hydrolase family 28 protein [Zasmidium cellare ATCC 36951]|uniref:Glycoside hydrolase family 28 protein n=1 Tax=Zasmidium cellare ATCC 36951 TaxID=1080233 RepID=A0A6A6CHY4_ZASCE|nr:glycoside hydrolase family 28 protein [Zasmidium cellare ATCC 36951]KAF2165562.1 glycoside hydrolase family 28 protein [Zasmidium cellare ATCC 36951]